MGYASAWSGGKDCNFALLKAKSLGYEITHLVNILSENGHVETHGVPGNLVRLQAMALGMPIVQKPAPTSNFTKIFSEVLAGLKDKGIEGVIFADLPVQHHRDWVKHWEWSRELCRNLSIEMIQLLWGEDPTELFREFLASGIEAVVTSARADLFGEEWLGHAVDNELEAHLADQEIDLFGEAGEYHTFVVNSPLFTQRIEITSRGKSKRGNYWFLDPLPVTDYPESN